MGTLSQSASQFQDLVYPGLRLRDFTLDDNLLNHPQSPPENGSIRKSPGVDLGALDVLPLELLHMLLIGLDLRTFTDFRRINRRAMEVVESIPQYKAVITHAHSVLLGIMSIETGRWITCQTLYDKLCTAECEECGDFGGYIYVLTCKRVCFLCFSEDKRYIPLSYSDAIRKFGVNRQILETLPRMRSIPGIYSPNEKKSRTRLTLVDYKSARRAGIALHGLSSAMEQYVSNMAAQKLQEYNKRVDQAAEGPGSTTRRLRRPRTEDLFDGQSGNPMRFLAIVRAPWLNTVSQELEWGFHCSGCRGSYRTRPLLHCRRKFAAASFSEHLRHYGEFRNGKHTSIEDHD